MEKPLLILDLDETLIRGQESPLSEGEPHDMLLGPYFVYFRPHARSFLAAMGEHFRLGFWSSATLSYVGPICRQLMKGQPEPLFVWGRERCTERFDHFKRETYYAKDLRHIEKNGISLARVLIVDDELRKVNRHYGNALIVRPFLGDAADDELPKLESFLRSVSQLEDLRRVEKSKWSADL